MNNQTIAFLHAFKKNDKVGIIEAIEADGYTFAGIRENRLNENHIYGVYRGSIPKNTFRDVDYVLDVERFRAKCIEYCERKGKRVSCSYTTLKAIAANEVLNQYSPERVHLGLEGRYISLAMWKKATYQMELVIENHLTAKVDIYFEPAWKAIYSPLVPIIFSYEKYSVVVAPCVEGTETLKVNLNFEYTLDSTFEINGRNF